MDKRGRNQKVKKNWISILGKCGIIQSLVIHTVILLIMALSFTIIHTNHPIKLSLNLETETLEEFAIEPIEIQTPQPEQTELDHAFSDILDEENDSAISIDIPEIIKELTPSIPAENLSLEVVNSIVTEDTSSISKHHVSTRKTLSGAPSSKDRFNGMMKGKLDDRLAKHGARSGDVQISIAWDDYNDIDLWVEFEPFNFRNNKYLIGWSNRESINGGYLDIDMNVHPFTNEAVENIVWPKNRSPYGTYVVYAHYYHQWDKNSTTQVYIRVQNKDEIVYKKGTVTFGTGPKRLHTFTRRPSKY